MKIGEFFKSYPAVSNLLVSFLATLLAYGAIKWIEARNTASTDTPKTKERLPAPATATTVASENAQEVTQTVQ